MIGRTISHYDIIEKLGEGGMGVVYKARDTQLERFVAVKVLPAEKVADPERKRRFVQEAKAASALNHPNIITIYEIASDGDADFIVMEYVDGKTLDQLIGRKGLYFGEALKYAVQIADALAAAHSAGIIHRDLKPGNIMITSKGLAKVLDFGLAKLVESAETNELTPTLSMRPPNTEEGAIVGTVAYMSPEQAEGKKLDARSDIFSFGGVLYEMTTGRRAFQGNTKLSILTAIGRDEPKPASEIVPEIPRDLEKIIYRCLRKDPEYRFQHMDDLKVALRELKEESDSGKLRPVASIAAGKTGRRRLAWIGGAALLIAAGGALWLRFHGRPEVTSTATNPALTRVTADSGWSTDPALSPDGKLIAYASDRGGQGNLNIWLKQVGGGESIQLTRHDADDRDPVFSPDGRTIAFHSEREGGGIYIISTLGGEPRKIASQGRNPRFSPDGSWIAYWVGALGGGIAAETFVVASTGGTVKSILPGFWASYPTWSPDGKRLIFLGANRDAKLSADETLDWWSALLEGGAAVKTGVYTVFRSQKLSTIAPAAPAWLPGGYLLFTARTGDTSNLWKIPVSLNTWRATGPAERVTSGTTFDVKPSVAIGPQDAVHVAFASQVVNFDIRELPIDANRGKVSGELRRLTEDAASDIQPAISADGKKVAFVSWRSGNPDIWIKDLGTGKEAPLAETSRSEFSPAISPDGSRLAYAVREGESLAIYAVPMSPGGHAGALEKLCDDCGYNVSWSPDGTKVLYTRGDPASGVHLLDIASRRKTPLFVSPNYSLFEPYFSPDGRWISFNATTVASSRIYVAEFRGQPVQQSEWVAETKGDPWDDNPRWSPDGNLLYFTSEADGFRCISAQRMDPGTKQPKGSPIPIYHFHHARRSLLNVTLNSLKLSVARDRIVFTMGERSGNIWMAELEGK